MQSRDSYQNSPQEWRDLLQKRKSSILTAEGSFRRQAIDELLGNNSGELSVADDQHPGDSATDTQRIEILGSLSERSIRHLHEIEDALDRVRNGTFGICQNCEEPISEKRLRVLPEARFCIECEREIEDMQKNSGFNRKMSSTTFSPALQDSLGRMRVSDVMRTDLLTVNLEESLYEAANLLSENPIRHLPVIDDQGDVQGVLSDRDLLNTLLGSSPDELLNRAANSWGQSRVREIMTKTPVTIEPDEPLSEAATLLLENKISCLPVVEGAHLVGIVTESDFVRLAVGAS